MSSYADAQKQALDKLTDELRQAAGGTYAYFEKRRKKLVGQSKQKLVEILQHLKQDAPVGNLADVTLALYNYFRGRASDNATTVANCAPERPEPVSAERQPRGQLRSPCRRDRSRSRDDSFSPRRNRRNRSSSPVRPEPSYHTASSQPNLEEMKKDITFMKQAFLEQQKAKAEADALAAKPYRITQGVQRVGSAAGSLLNGTVQGAGSLLNGTVQGAGALLNGTVQGAGALLNGTVQGAGALLNGTLERATSAGQAMVITAGDASQRAGDFAEGAMSTTGKAAIGYGLYKVADAVINSKCSPPTKDMTNFVVGVIATGEVVRQVAKFGQENPAIGDIPDSHC